MQKHLLLKVTLSQLRWQKYLQRLSEGAWGDNITVQGICEMLNITINILSTLNPHMVVITPSTGTSQGNIYRVDRAISLCRTR